MSTKLKALGAGLLAMLAVGAFGVMNAVAESGGYFTAGSPETTIVGTVGGEHQLEFTIDGGTPIVCDEELYHGTMSATDAAITITPQWNECHTKESATVVVIDLNGCDLEFTVGEESEGDNTASLKCEGEKSLVLTHPNCEIRISPQTVTKGGVAYTTDTLEGQHAITADVTAEEITVHYEKSICVFLGTSHKATMSGSVTVQGFGIPAVDLTAVGK